MSQKIMNIDTLDVEGFQRKAFPTFKRIPTCISTFTILFEENPWLKPNGSRTQKYQD